MLNAPLHPRQQLTQDSQWFMAKADTLLAPSRALVAWGKARAVARTRASWTDAAPLELYAQLHEAYPEVWANIPMPPDKGGLWHRKRH